MWKFQKNVARVLSALFIWAGITKLFNLSDFESVLATYQLFPNWSIPWLAVTVPWLEVILGVCVLFPFTKKSAAVGIFSLNIVFILVLLSVLVRGITISCGCFGVELLPVGPWTVPLAILRDLLFLVMAWCIFTPTRWVKVPNYEL